jgi:hypothetical protein
VLTVSYYETDGWSLAYQSSGCEVGNYITEDYKCLPCPVGTYTDLTDQSSCLPCWMGTYSVSVGTITCPPCPQGTYKDFMGNGTCVVCPENTQTDLLGAMSISQCTCKDGYYSSMDGLAGVPCKPCPTGAVCTNSIPYAKPLYWNSPNNPYH